MKEILIVGAGPAGLATAINLARRGFRPRILEKRAGIQDKPCGEGLMPIGVELLRRLGVAEPEHFPFVGVAYNAHDGSRARIRFPTGPGWGIRRTALSAVLRARAAELGVPIEQGALAEIPRDRLVIGADGLHSRVRRLAGLELPGRTHHRWGARQHFFVPPWSPYVEVHMSPGVEVYLTPVSSSVVGASILWSSRVFKPKGDLIPALLGRFPRLSHLLEAPTASAPAAIGPFEQKSSLYRGNVVLIGDASGYLDAITGEGISLALGQAEALAQSIELGDLEHYRREHTRLYQPYRQVTSMLLWLTKRPTLSARVVRALAQSEAFFSHLVMASMGLRPIWPPPIPATIRFLYHLARGTRIQSIPDETL